MDKAALISKIHERIEQHNEHRKRSYALIESGNVTTKDIEELEDEVLLTSAKIFEAKHTIKMIKEL
jgi:adenosyl cobinamide kinase/adenosyl cobinamide phosphate guanylyltransferase